MSRRLVHWLLFSLLLIGVLSSALQVRQAEADGTIYIRVDGSIDPPTAPIQRSSDRYTLTHDIYNKSIVVQRDNIRLDGAGHKLVSFQISNYFGIDLSYRNYVAVTNFVISGFQYGIMLQSSYNNQITQNTISLSNLYCIYLSDSRYNTLANNIVTNASYHSIWLWLSDHNTLLNNKVEYSAEGINLQYCIGVTMRNNAMTHNRFGLAVVGEAAFAYLPFFMHDIDTSNTVNGKPVYYLVNRHDETISLDAGALYVVNSTRMTIRDMVMENCWAGVKLAFTTDSLVENITARKNRGGIVLTESYSNTVIGNNVNDSDENAGICLYQSTYTYVADNSVSFTNSSGIWLEDTSYNTIVHNTVTDSIDTTLQEHCGTGVLVDDSDHCTVMYNYLTRNAHGISVGSAPAAIADVVAENEITANDCGITIDADAGSKIYHNNFINNTHRSEGFGRSFDLLDNGYPSGGNYWSDYTGCDQNGDGIGDSPCILYETNKDRYPLMSPYGKSPLPMYNLTILSSGNGTTNPAPASYRHSKGQNIPVQAIPNSGSTFYYWELDGENIGNSNPANVLMNSDHHLLSVFGPPRYDVTIRAHCNTEDADVAVGIAMDSLPTGHITPHTFVSLTGTHTFTLPSRDEEEHLLKQWNTGQNNTVITVSLAGTYVASYDVKYSLTITTSPGGTTNPLPSTSNHWSGTSLNVEAMPESGYYLDYWQLDGTSIGAPPDPLKVKMDRNHTLNAMFAHISPGHDVAVKHVETKAAVGAGCPSTIRVNARNVGSYTETFNVIVYVDSTPIALQTITLANGSSTTLTFTWNTTSFNKGDYTLSAYATPVPDEEDTTDNLFGNVRVRITIVGDVNGDRKVDLKDVYCVGFAYGATIGHPRWDAVCDINNDDKVDLKDYFVTCRNYGKTDL